MLIAILAVAGTIAGFVLSSGVTVDAQPSMLRRPTGSPQLISSEPLPQMGELQDGQMCQWEPASASSSLVAALRHPRQAARASGQTSRAEAAAKDPVRVIRDPYAAYSSVAVDPVRNEVVMTDENLFNIMVYDRLANTPPNASMTEPKRMIGGLSTNIQFNCGIYIEPNSGDIYAVNNDTVRKLVVFSRQAKGDVPPDRELDTPYGSFGIAVDEQNQELFLTVQHDSAVVSTRWLGDDAPIRLLQGDRTRMADPHGIALDTKDLMFVVNGTVHQVAPRESLRARKTGRWETIRPQEPHQKPQRPEFGPGKRCPNSGWLTLATTRLPSTNERRQATRRRCASFAARRLRRRRRSLEIRIR